MKVKMAVFAFLILLSLSSADDLEVKRALILYMNASCPGNILHVTALASDDTPVPDIELRLIQYEPYQGLRALMHTNSSGEARFELTRAASYRIYIHIVNDTYNHEDYVDYNYPKICPPPPPKQMNATIEADCGAMSLKLTLRSQSYPVDSALVMSPKWSSLSNNDGVAILPFEEGYVLLSIQKSGFSDLNITERVLCAGCMEDFDCAEYERCGNRSCVNVSVLGSCGYASAHTWYPYQCCKDADCGKGNIYICANSTCVEKPIAPPPIISQNVSEASNASANVSRIASPAAPNSESQQNPVCGVGFISVLSILGLVTLSIRR